MSCVLSLMSRPLTASYRPTPHAVNWWFHCLNREVFRERLPCVRLRATNERDSWGYYVAPDLIAYRRVYETKQQFVAVLAHEMVHHWQACTGREQAHGASFLRWQPVFRRYGMLLMVHGDVHVPTLH